MTIAELRNAPPQTSQYLDAQLLAIGLAKVITTTRGERCVQACQVIDRQGQKENITYWFDADKPDFAMPTQQINQWLQWKVKTKPNGQYLNISGYPEKAAEQPQIPPPLVSQQPTQLNPQTQAIIDNQFKQPTGPQAAQQIQDHMAGPVNPVDPTSNVPDYPVPSPQDYAAKEREKIIGMCMCGHVNARLVNTPPAELLADKAQFADLWQIATQIVDGTGRVEEETRF